MDKFYTTVLCILSFSAVLLSTEAADCKDKAKCIALQECKGLYTQLEEQGRNEELTSLLQTLHCGFDEYQRPKICCPPMLQNPLSNRNSFRGDSLLPDADHCGIMDVDRIVGGELTDIYEHPWMALLQYNKTRGSGFYCGGVLISSRYVLTAAHCVSGADIPPSFRLVQVRLGEWNLTSDRDCNDSNRQMCSNAVIDVPIEKLIPHENYDPNNSEQTNDIALLRLAREVPFTDFIQPICLPLNENLKRSKFDGYELEVAGWGKTETSSSSDVKLKVRLPVVSRDRCVQVYGKARRNIYNTQLCAGGKRAQDSCRGDSGGPLMGQVPGSPNWYVVGIVSYGPTPCGTPGWPGVYTRVGAYINWITANLEP